MRKFFNTQLLIGSIAVISLVVSGYSYYCYYWQLRQSHVLAAGVAVNQQHWQQLQQQVQQLKRDNQTLHQKMSVLQSQYTTAQPIQLMHFAAAKINLHIALQQILSQQNKDNILLSLTQVKHDLQAVKLDSAFIEQVDHLLQLTSALPNPLPLDAIQQLRVLDAHLSNLQFKLPTIKPQHNPYKITGWRSALHASLLHLRSLLVIRHNSNVGQLLLTQTNQQQVALALHMLLQEAIWCILTQSSHYHTVMKMIQRHVVQLTIANSQQVQWLVQLAKIDNITIAYPQHLMQPLVRQIKTLSAELHREDAL